MSGGKQSIEVYGYSIPEHTGYFRNNSLLLVPAPCPHNLPGVGEIFHIIAQCCNERRIDAGKLRKDLVPDAVALVIRQQVCTVSMVFYVPREGISFDLLSGKFNQRPDEPDALTVTEWEIGNS